MPKFNVLNKSKMWSKRNTLLNIEDNEWKRLTKNINTM